MEKKMISRRNFVGLSAAAAASLALAGCGSNSSDSASTETKETEAPKELKTVRLGALTCGHVFNAIADKKGFLEEEGVKVEVSVFSTSDEAFAALFSGKIDVTANSGTNLPLTHIANGQDLTIWSRYMLTGCMPIIAPKGTVWNGVEDLAGKTIACSGNEYAVFGPFVEAGHSMDEVTTIVLSNHADRVEAVRSGKADYAICGTSQNYNISQTDEVEVMCYESDITPNYSCCCAESMQSFLDENEEAAKGVLRAWLRAQCWYEQNKDEACEMLAEQTDATLEYVHAFVDNEHLRLSVDPYKSTVERAWNWMISLGFMPDEAQDINIDDHINTAFYKDCLDDCTKRFSKEEPEFYEKANKIYEEFDA